MAYVKCKKCGGHYFDDMPHKCPPKWNVKDEDEGFDTDVYAYDEEAAAELWGEYYDRDEPTLAVDNSKKVWVYPDGVTDKAEAKQFSVSGELVVRYNARRIEND